MKKFIPYLIGFITFALIADVSYDLWGFGAWQSVILANLTAYLIFRFIKHTEAR